MLAGIRTGALPQVGGIGGALTGLLVMLNAAPWLLEVTTGSSPSRAPSLVLGAILGAVILGEALGSAIGRAIADRLGEGVLSGMDRVAGGLRWAPPRRCSSSGSRAASWRPARSRRLAQTASPVHGRPHVDEYLPPPTEVIGQIAGALDDSGLPDVFVGLEPIPLQPVDTPTTRRRERIAGDAVDSTARVVTRACDTQVTGTAFLVAPGYLVTNAHVVAGASTIRLTTGDGVADADAVLFDPDLDVALLYAPEVDGPVLGSPPTRPDRGTLGAALGYAGGGPARRAAGRGLRLVSRHGPRHLRHGPGDPRHPGAARRGGARRLGRAAGARGRHGGRARVRGVEDGPGRGLRAHARGGVGRGSGRRSGATRAVDVGACLR